ncbi:MAG: UDP-N-acetylenolpyruvoylglucosamine reductase, partial [Kiritimatiellae bacterium]|nr:UDP-N-acetylenolpyruvoylglucosamine reductase [Kiritimatiellia bacterium]
CSTLSDLIVLEAGFKLEYGDRTESKNRRVAYADKRRWMRGLRSCGSVFKNPDGDFAGRLIEEAGLKGKSIGGASVSEEHANFIITDYNATASDVQVLIEYVRATVLKLYGVDLVREVKYL